ncbi:MAG: aminopeptidase P family protein [Candidatus Bathyarchaeota archaeon]|nr:MAG: aminopeptidase P family protein [Candidatus Bathyarchaeota archaeon]
MTGIFGQFGVDWETRIDFQKLRSDRLERIKAQMRQMNVDCLLSFRPENIRYTTAYRALQWFTGMSVTRNTVVLPQEGDPILYVASGDWKRSVSTMPWLKKENIRPLAVLEDPEVFKTTGRTFNHDLTELGVANGRIGIDATRFGLTQKMQQMLPEAEFVDGDEVFTHAKRIKTEEECQLMRLSSAIASFAMERTIGKIRSGMKECELLGEAMRTLYSFGMEVPQCNLIVASGNHTMPLYRFATDKLIRRNEFVLLDLGGCFNGYFSDFTRTVIHGTPTEKQKAVYRTVYATMQTIFRVMKPGVLNTEVCQAVRTTVKEHGFEKEAYFGVLGHGIGIGGLEAPFIGERMLEGEQKFVEFKLQPGMVFSMEPTVAVAGIGGVRLEDTILITKTGNEVLSTAPYDEKLLG